QDVFRSEPEFRGHVNRCADILEPLLGLDLRDVLYSNGGETGVSIDETWLGQPALFTIEYALARLWMSWGVRPDTLIGHSLGEYVAACLAGVFSLEDALKLVASRGRLAQGTAPGAMLAVPMPAEEARALLDESLALAAVNEPARCVVSGDVESIARLERD